jgi:hypothetical protein
MMADAVPEAVDGALLAAGVFDGQHAFDEVKDAPQSDADLLVREPFEGAHRIGEQLREVGEILNRRGPRVLDRRVEHGHDPVLERHLEPHRRTLPAGTDPAGPGRVGGCRCG